MKKLITTSDYKRRNTINASNSRKKRNKRVGKKNNDSKPKTFQPIRKKGIKGTFRKELILQLAGKSKTSFIPIKSPEDFSMINNTEEMLDYFEDAKKQLMNKNKILFDISHVKTLTTDAIAVQIAKIKDVNFHNNTAIIGNGPEDYSLKKLFFQSGFYDYVITNGPKPTNHKKLLIHEITNNRVEPDIAKKACLLGLKHTFNNEEIFEPLYDILIEVMQNTNNHAGSTRGKYDWWLHVYNHPESTTTSYTFLDLGIGIFESLPVKSYKRDFLELLGLKSNLELVPKLFAGEIKSRTARPERGKGIPQVFECSQDPTFNKFILISNDIYADLKSQEYKLLKNEFVGTLYYWEIVNNVN